MQPQCFVYKSRLLSEHLGILVDEVNKPPRRQEVLSILDILPFLYQQRQIVHGGQFRDSFQSRYRLDFTSLRIDKATNTKVL